MKWLLPPRRAGKRGLLGRSLHPRHTRMVTSGENMAKRKFRTTISRGEVLYSLQFKLSYTLSNSNYLLFKNPHGSKLLNIDHQYIKNTWIDNII
jgi:hypothetical protein